MVVIICIRGGCMVVWWLALLPHSKRVGSNPSWGLSVWSLHVLPVYARVFSEFSSFFPPHVRLN